MKYKQSKELFLGKIKYNNFCIYMYKTFDQYLKDYCIL